MQIFDARLYLHPAPITTFGQVWRCQALQQASIDSVGAVSMLLILHRLTGSPHMGIAANVVTNTAYIIMHI